MTRMMMLNGDYPDVAEVREEGDQLIIIDPSGSALRQLSGITRCVFAIELDDALRFVENFVVTSTTYAGEAAWQISGTIRNDSEEGNA